MPCRDLRLAGEIELAHAALLPPFAQVIAKACVGRRHSQYF
jgi:hypothetical protein